MKSDRRPIIAIDGPVGSGKSQAARRVADRLGLLYVDTGAMYRSVTLAALQRKIDLNNPKELANLAHNLTIVLQRHSSGLRIFCDGEDVTTAIRDPQVSAGTSVVADNPDVREALVAQQKRMGEKGGLVMEGRDIGTVVFPEAEFKIYLEASPEVRARRRHDELTAAGIPSNYEETLAALIERDRRDTTRPVGPLRIAPGARVIDTTNLTLDEVVDCIVAVVQQGK